jgi:hypothetical protein
VFANRTLSQFIETRSGAGFPSVRRRTVPERRPWFNGKLPDCGRKRDYECIAAGAEGRVMNGELLEFKRGATSIALRFALAPVL